MIGCNHTSFEWTRAVRHIYGIKRHMQGLYTIYLNLRYNRERDWISKHFKFLKETGLTSFYSSVLFQENVHSTNNISFY